MSLGIGWMSWERGGVSQERGGMSQEREGVSCTPGCPGTGWEQDMEER